MHQKYRIGRRQFLASINTPSLKGDRLAIPLHQEYVTTLISLGENAAATILQIRRAVHRSIHVKRLDESESRNILDSAHALLGASAMF